MFFASYGNAQPTTLYVAAGGTNSGNSCAVAANPCGTVSYALTQAVANSTINVAGTIDDNISISLGAPVVTISGASSPAVLDGGGAGTVLGLTETAVTLDDLTIEQGSGTYGGVLVNGGTLTLTNSTVSANAGPGIWSTFGGKVNLDDGTVENNSGPGIVQTDNVTATVTGSTVSGNTGGGIVAENCQTGSCGVAVSGSTISNNPGGPGVSVDGFRSVSNSTISGNGSAGIVSSQLVTVTGSTVSNNASTGITAIDGASISASTISGNKKGGVSVNGGANSPPPVPVAISGNTVTGNTGGSGITACDECAGPDRTTVTITDNTVADNTATDGGGIDGGSYSTAQPSLTIRSPATPPPTVAVSIALPSTPVPRLSPTRSQIIPPPPAEVFTTPKPT